MLTQDESKTTIGPETQAFSRLEYDLKLCLNSSTARITHCWQLSNPHLCDQFHRLSNDQLTLPSWIDAKELVGGNTEEDVLKRGFHVVPPNKGMKISVGSFLPSKGDGGIHKALLCEVLVGRSYTVEKSAVDEIQLPSGYKSFYLQDDANPSADYLHEYFINNPAYIIPRYLVQFEYDSKVEQDARQKHKCDDCEKELAAVYCEADKAYLCKTCDTVLHKTKISRMHVRKPVGEGVDVFGMCKTHPSRLIQYFCSQCHEPVCIDCTIMGSHAKSEEGKHALVSVEEYFKTVLEESKMPNPPLIERRNAINDQISNIQSRADAVVDMGKQITSKIEEICARAKKECNDIVLKKLTVLNGDEFELRRQIGEIDRLEDFLKYQQAGDSMNCVSTWHLHQMCREKLCDFKFFRQEIDVQLDAQISGKLAVIVDQDKASMTAQSTSSASNNNSPKKKPVLPSRAATPPAREMLFKTSKDISPIYASPSAPSQYGVLGNGKGLPKVLASKSQWGKVERRTSDFFHEALSFGGSEDYDSLSIASGI